MKRDSSFNKKPNIAQTTAVNKGQHERVYDSGFWWRFVFKTVERRTPTSTAITVKTTSIHYTKKRHCRSRYARVLFVGHRMYTTIISWRKRIAQNVRRYMCVASIACMCSMYVSFGLFISMTLPMWWILRSNCRCCCCCYCRQLFFLVSKGKNFVFNSFIGQMFNVVAHLLQLQLHEIEWPMVLLYIAKYMLGSRPSWAIKN